MKKQSLLQELAEREAAKRRADEEKWKEDRAQLDNHIGLTRREKAVYAQAFTELLVAHFDLLIADDFSPSRSVWIETLHLLARSVVALYAKEGITLGEPLALYAWLCYEHWRYEQLPSESIKLIHPHYALLQGLSDGFADTLIALRSEEFFGPDAVSARGWYIGVQL